MSKKYDFTNQKIGKLTVLRLCNIEERPSANHGNYWLCQCDCGNLCKVPTTYLTGNSNYTQTSCGCDRKLAAFLKTNYRKDLKKDYLEKQFPDFEKYLLLHKAFVRTSDIDIINIPLDEYKTLIEHFYNNKQFNAIYDFWANKKSKENTFYDWAKPSLDHIIPKSRGGKEEMKNFQFLTVFENLSKRDMTMEEWNQFKKDTNTHSDYFIEEIMTT